VPLYGLSENCAFLVNSSSLRIQWESKSMYSPKSVVKEYSIMLPTCTSGSVNVFAKYFRPLAFTIVLSKAFPSKFAIVPSGRTVRAFKP